MTSHLCALKCQFFRVRLRISLFCLPWRCWHWDSRLATETLPHYFHQTLSGNLKGNLETAAQLHLLWRSVLCRTGSLTCLLQTRNLQMARVSDLQTTRTSKRLINDIKLVCFFPNVRSFQSSRPTWSGSSCAPLDRKANKQVATPHTWASAASFFLLNVFVGQGRGGSSLTQRGHAGMHPAAVDPFCPSVQQLKNAYMPIWNTCSMEAELTARISDCNQDDQDPFKPVFVWTCFKIPENVITKQMWPDHKKTQTNKKKPTFYPTIPPFYPNFLSNKHLSGFMGIYICIYVCNISLPLPLFGVCRYWKTPSP